MSDHASDPVHVAVPLARRDELVRRFADWLDETLAREEAPGGLDLEIVAAVSAIGAAEEARAEARGESADPAAGDADAYALWAAMTRLAHEVKLQGRAFKDLSVALESQAAQSAEALRSVYQERERQLQRDVERRCQRQMLEPLLDLRDRLVRGLDSTRAAVSAAEAGSQGWLPRLLPTSTRQRRASSALAAVVRGYELGLEHLDRMLADLNVRPLRCQGEPFDPRRMNAIETEPSSAVPEGTVLEVYRTGYEWNGELFRPAQVKVSVSR